MTKRHGVIHLLIVIIGCGPNADRAPSLDSAGALAVRETTAVADSSRIIVTGPTLVVLFRGAYTAADSGGDNAEALGDLQYHLGSARPSLDSLGVTVEERYGERIDYALDGAAHRFVPLRDSSRAVLLFLTPGGAAQQYYGILSHIELVREARTRFKIDTR